MNEHKLAEFTGRNLHIRDLERHANDEREVGEIHVVGKPVTREIEPARVLLRPCRAIRITVISVGVTEAENRVHQEPRGNDRKQTHQQMQNDVRPLDVLVCEEKKANRKQPGTSREDNEDEDDSAADVLFLRSGAKFMQRRGYDRQPCQDKNAQSENVPCGN